MAIAGIQPTQHQQFATRQTNSWSVLKLIGVAATLAAVYFGGMSREMFSFSQQPLGAERRVRPSSYEYEERTPHPGIVLIDTGTTGYPIEESALQKTHEFRSWFTRYAEGEFRNQPEIVAEKAASQTRDTKGYLVGGMNPNTGKPLKAILAVSPQKLPNQKQAIKQADSLASKAFSSSSQQTLDRIRSLHETALKGFDQASPGHFRKDVSVVFKDDHIGRTESELTEAVRARGTKQDLEIFQKQVIPKIKKNALPKLTPREKEVFGLIASVAPSPETVPGLMREFSTELNAGFRRMEQDGNFDSVGFAAWAHQKLTEIHPFGDGNGRVARLLQNAILKKAGHPPVVFDSDESYMQAVNRDFEERGTYARFLREQIGWTQRELVDADPCLPQLTC